jgi:FkbM family methyltransferase
MASLMVLGLGRIKFYLYYCLGLDSGDVTKRQLCKFLDEGCVVFDVGANHGEFTKSVLESYPNAKVYAFDIQSELKDKFLALKENSYEVSFHGRGLSEASGWASIDRQRVGDRKAKLGIGIDRQVKMSTVDIEISRLRLSSLDLLKIDTEGHDLLVLKGASKSLSENKITYIIFEVLASNNQQSFGVQTPTLKDFIDYLEKYNFYYFYRVSPVLGLIPLRHATKTQKHVTNILATKVPLKLYRRISKQKKH